MSTPECNAQDFLSTLSMEGYVLHKPPISKHCHDLSTPQCRQCCIRESEHESFKLKEGRVKLSLPWIAASWPEGVACAGEPDANCESRPQKHSKQCVGMGARIFWYHGRNLVFKLNIHRLVNPMKFGSLHCRSHSPLSRKSWQHHLPNFDATQKIPKAM